MVGVWFLEKAQDRTDWEKGELSVKGERKKRKKNCLYGAQTVLVTKDQIGHFLKPLDVLGNTPNLRSS